MEVNFNFNFNGNDNGNFNFNVNLNGGLSYENFNVDSFTYII